MSPFAPLTELRKLNLSHNEISTIFDDWRFLMTQLEFLDLSYNKFTNISVSLSIIFIILVKQTKDDFVCITFCN